MNDFALDDSRLVRLAQFVPDVVARKDYGRAFVTIGGRFPEGLLAVVEEAEPPSATAGRGLIAP